MRPFMDFSAFVPLFFFSFLVARSKPSSYRRRLLLRSFIPSLFGVALIEVGIKVSGRGELPH